MKSPAFQFYASDFLVGVMGMSDDEIGVYIKMLAFQWVKGGLPADPKTIRIAINSRKNPSENVLKKFTVSEDGLLRNERLEQERKKQAIFRESRADNAKKGWDKKRTSNARASMSICIAACENDALQSSVFNLQSSDYSPPTPSEETTPSAPPVPPTAGRESVGGMDSLKTRINQLKPEWGRPTRWSYAEEQHLFNGTAAQMEELTDDDWRLIRDFLNTRMPQGANYWQPRNRQKFAETFANVLSDALRWAENTARPKPKQPLPEGYK